MENMEQIETDGALQLNPEIAKQRQDTYSSLTDLHGIDIFSDSFNDRAAEVEAERQTAEMQLKNYIFVEETEDIDTDSWLLSQLFIEKEGLVLTQDYTGSKERLSIIDIGITAVVVLAVAALYLFVFNDKKARRKKI